MFNELKKMMHEQNENKEIENIFFKKPSFRAEENNNWTEKSGRGVHKQTWWNRRKNEWT